MRFDYLLTLLLLRLPLVNGDCTPCRTEAIQALCPLPGVEYNHDPLCLCPRIGEYRSILKGCVGRTGNCNNNDYLYEEEYMDTDCGQYEKYFRTETTTFPTITVILRGFSTVITGTDLLAAASGPTATISDVQGSGTSVYAPESYPTWTSEVSNGMSPWKIGTIVGGILAGLLTVALLGFSAFLVARRRKRKAAVRRLEVSPGKEDDAVAGVAELSTSAALSPLPIIPELDTSTAVMELNLPPNIRELGPFPRETKHELHG